MQSETSLKINAMKMAESALKIEQFKAKGGKVYQAAIGESAIEERFVHSTAKREEAYQKRHGHKYARQSD